MQPKVKIVLVKRAKRLTSGMSNSKTRSASAMSSARAPQGNGHSDLASQQSGGSSSLPSFSSTRAADMFAAYSNSCQEMGPGARDSGSGVQNLSAASASTSPSEITDGAKRLAQELDHFINQAPDKALDVDGGSSTALSEDGIADLQLQTARKLREVRTYVAKSSYYTFVV